MSDCLLRLYIAGKSAIAQRAEQNIRQLQRAIKSQCEIEVIDVLTNPELAERAGVLATPTLSYEHPSRSRRIIGDLSDTRRVVQFLGIETREGKE